MAKLTHERLLTVLNYAPDTGVFTWKVRSSNRIQVGDRAGVVGAKGYRFITVDGERLQASRVAWFYEHGEWPKGDIVFDDGDTDNCAIANLKDLSRVEAARLRSAPASNTSGHKGVSPAKNGGWKAAITCNYKQINLGIFKSKEEAIEMQEAATAMMAGAVTPEECAAAADRVIQFRRKKVAWNRLQRSGRPTVWADFDAFAAEVGYVPTEYATVAAISEAQPIGPSNFKWLDRVEGKFDRSTKEGRAAYPGRWRHRHLKENYDIDDVQYHELLNKQFGVCAICEKGSEENLSADHNHHTGEVRGLLCKSCNYALGQFGDDINRLRGAVSYLERADEKPAWSAPSLTEITHLPVGRKLLMEARDG